MYRNSIPSLAAIGRAAIIFLAAGTFLASSDKSWAQRVAWPAQQSIKVVVPFPPGGGTDMLARMLAEKMRVDLNQNMVMDNRPGATGNIGNDLVAKAAPDGYTILVQGTIIGMFPHIFNKLSYDPVKDLQAVGTIAESPNVIVVNPTSPFNSVAELVAAGKSRPGSLNYGTAGVGSPQHLALEQVANIAGIKLQHITYRGTAPAVTDLLANQTDLGAFSLSSVLSLIQGKKLRVLAVMSEKRTPLLADVPTLQELGFAGVDSSIRFAFFVPTGTPQPIIARLNQATQRTLNDPTIKSEFAKAGYEAVASSPEQTSAMVQKEYTTWGPIVKQLGLKME
jgi:tripartite-type tricarboxylate transporter receptor subunit TctC